MIAPVWDIAYTTDDVSDASPSWTNVAVANIRSVDISRGRDDELGRVDAGTATLVLNNLTRLFDPQVVTGLRPMNRWRIRAVYNAVTYPLFLGYAESYEQQWPATGQDAITVVRLVDEFKVLALDTLPTMDPPTARTYADVVLFDQPQGYWRFQEEYTSDDRIMVPAAGGVSMSFDLSWGRTASPIVGDPDIDYIGGTPYGARSTTARFFTFEGSEYTGVPGLPTNGPGDAGGLSAFSFEMWFKSSEATPAAQRTILLGPESATPGTFSYIGALTTAGKIAFGINTTAGSATATGATSISANTWYHLAFVYSSGTALVYLNGVQDGSATPINDVVAMGAGAYLQLGPTTAVGGTRYFDEPAFYRYALPAARVLAHYTAGVNRGYPTQAPEDRAAAVVADSTSIAATDFNSTIGREMIPAFIHGQSPLEELRKAEQAEQGFLFIANDGTITMLQLGYQGISPYNVIQATFDDDGTDLPYRDITSDYSEQFLYNEVTASHVGGELYTTSDATSISRYGKRTLQLPDLPIITDEAPIADYLLSLYKDPITRITSLAAYLKSAAVIAAMLPLDLGALVRILRTHPAGGARIDQQLQVQKFQLSARPGQAWTVTIGVAP